MSGRTAFIVGGLGVMAALGQNARAAADPVSVRRGLAFAEDVFGCDWDVMSDTLASGPRAFASARSDDMFLRLLERFRELEAPL